MDDKPASQQGGIAGVFSRAAKTYDRVGPQIFVPFGEHLVELANIKAGSHVLDVASGRGAVLLPAASRVGPEGRAIGTDLSAGMVSETAADIKAKGLNNAEVLEMDACNLDFPAESFDCVTCGVGIGFFPDPHRALQEFFRVLKPGGKLALSTWAASSPYIVWCFPAFAESLPPSKDLPKSNPAPALNVAENLEDALRQAGFVDIETSFKEEDFIYADEGEWWASLWSAGLRGKIEGLESPALAQVKDKMLAKVQELRQSDGIHNVYRALIALGTKAEK